MQCDNELVSLIQCSPHHVEDGLLAEHDLEEGVLVQQEDVAEDLVEVVQALHVLQVLGGDKSTQATIYLIFDLIPILCGLIGNQRLK